MVRPKYEVEFLLKQLLQGAWTSAVVSNTFDMLAGLVMLGLLSTWLMSQTNASVACVGSTIYNDLFLHRESDPDILALCESPCDHDW